MCGIAGIISNKNKISINREKLFKIMHQRGPDAKGFHSVKDKNYELNFYHSRLSIIDNNKRSNQPFYYKNFVMIYNGEIYNFNEIRSELKKNKYKFFTSSDTEVIIKAFDKWGINCFKKFDGMWSIAIYDSKKGELILSRDIFGEKPLYLFKYIDTLIFGSEIKYIQFLDKSYKSKIINSEHIDTYLKNGYRFLNKSNKTYFKNIFKIDSGTVNIFSLGNLELKKKIKIINDKFNNKIKISRKDAVNVIKEKVINSVKTRLISDQPIGYYLSGGMDTGSITSISSKILNNKITCFSIVDKDKRYNEEINIDRTAKDIGCKLIKIKFPNNYNFINKLDNLIAYHDKPISSLNYYTHSFIHEHVKKNKIKVIISGLGGDEMFSGYYDHFLMHLRELKSQNFNENFMHWNKHIKPLIHNKNLKNINLFKNKNNRSYLKTELEKKLVKNIFKIKKIGNFYEENYSRNLLKNRMLNELFHEQVPLINNEDDMNSMKHSLENRSPFLNKDLMNFCMSLSSDLFINNGYAKSLLREAMDGILNNHVRLDRQKQGFNSSINSLVSLNTKQTLNFFYKNRYLNEYINVKEFCNFIKYKRKTNNAESKFIFAIFNIALFLEQHN